MRPAFLPNYDETNVLGRQYSLLVKTGALIPLTIDFRQFMFLSNSLEEDLRKEANKNSQKWGY